MAKDTQNGPTVELVELVEERVSHPALPDVCAARGFDEEGEVK